MTVQFSKSSPAIRTNSYNLPSKSSATRKLDLQNSGVKAACRRAGKRRTPVPVRPNLTRLACRSGGYYRDPATNVGGARTVRKKFRKTVGDFLVRCVKFGDARKWCASLSHASDS